MSGIIQKRSRCFLFSAPGHLLSAMLLVSIVLFRFEAASALEVAASLTGTAEQKYLPNVNVVSGHGAMA